MPQDATCPQCGMSFPVTEARHAFTVACPRCDAEMTVEFRKPAAPPEAGQPHHDLLVTPGALAGAAPPPAPKKRRDLDDEGDGPRGKGGSALVVALSAGFGLLVVLGGLGLTAWVLFGLIDTTPSRPPAKGNTPNAPGAAPNRPNPGLSRPVPNNPNTSNPGPPGAPPKPTDTFELKPVAGPVPPILPPALLDDPSNVDLGGKVGALAVGGGGRYLVMHFPDTAQLAVFDVNEMRVTATVPADGGDAQLAAGLTKVVLAAPDNARVFRAYSLPDLTKLYDASGADGLRGMAMGSRTDGPLLTVSVFGQVALWDVGGGGLTQVEGSAGKPQPEVHWHQKGVRALPDGTAFATSDGFHPHNKTTLLTVQGRRWKTAADVAAVPFPGPDGNFYGNGIVVNKAGQDHRVGGVGAGSNTWFLPSVSSKDYFLSIAPLTVGKEPRAKKTLTVTVHKARNANSAAPGTAAFGDLPEFEGLADRFGTTPPVPYDQHFFLVPEAKLLITLNRNRDRLVLRKVDVR